jgi:hypothetical protein
MLGELLRLAAPPSQSGFGNFSDWMRLKGGEHTAGEELGDYEDGERCGVGEGDGRTNI